MTGATYLGVGLYTLPDAARILRVSPSKLRWWVREYTYHARGRAYFHKPVIRRRFENDHPPLTFLELIELLFIKLFRTEGVSMPTIRHAASAATQLFDTNYPFAVKRFDTDGKRIFATLTESAGQKRILEELGRGQLVFEEFVRPFFRKLDYLGNAEVLRYWPLGRSRRVVLDPAREFGAPIDARTGVPTAALFNAVATEGTNRVDKVASWFEVPLQAVRDALDYERSIRRAA